MFIRGCVDSKVILAKVRDKGTIKSSKKWWGGGGGQVK